MERGEISSELRERKILKIILMMKNSQEFPIFCRSAEMDFHHLAGPRNVSVDLKYDVPCL